MVYMLLTSRAHTTVDDKIKKMLLLIDIQYNIIKTLIKRLDKIESRNYIKDSE